MKWVKGKDGKFAGSLGDGRAAPTPTPRRPPSPTVTETAAPSRVEDQHARFRAALPPSPLSSLPPLQEILWQGPPDQGADSIPTRIPLVVYGTLRQGQALDDGVLEGGASGVQDEHADEEAAVPAPRHVAYIRGDIYQSTGGDWPLLDTHGDGWVTCEVVSMDSDPGKGAWSKMGTDEIGWGYNVEYVPVSETPGGPPVGTALVCTWPWPEHRGAKIASGDWLKRG